MSIGDFTAQAAAYHQSRPTYPAAMLDHWQAHLCLRAEDPVVDIGAGTGILTALLAERRFKVTALEPNDAMRGYAEAHPLVEWRDATFEDTTLPTASQRWAVAAQAFHWANPEVALPEVARVLSAGSSFTIVFNDRDPGADELMAFVRATMLREVPEFDEAYRDRDWPAVLTSTGHFADVAYHEEAHVVPMPRDRFLQLWRGHNRLNNIAGPERFGRFFTAVSAYLEAGAVDVVPVAYRCRAWTARVAS